MWQHWQHIIKEEAEKYGYGESVEEAYGNPFTPSVGGWADPSRAKEKLSAGTKVKVPHKGKMVSGKIVRYDSGGTGQARQHGGGYIVDVGEPASILVPDHKIWKEEVEIEEAFRFRQQDWLKMVETYKKGTPVHIVLKDGKSVSGTLYRWAAYDQGFAAKGYLIYIKTSGGVVEIDDVNVKSIQWNNDAKTKMSEDVEIEEKFLSKIFGKKSPEFSRPEVGDNVKVPHKGKMVKGRIVGYVTRKVGIHGDPLGRSQIMDNGYHVDVGDATIIVPLSKIMKEGVEEAYAPLDTKGLIGAFTESSQKKRTGARFEYRISQNSWGKSHGLPHEVCVKFGGKSDDHWRAANVKGTVCYIAVDEGADGKPVMEKWKIHNHVKYVKAEGIEQQNSWKNIHEGAVENAQALAKEIKAKARELGVQISVSSSTSVSFYKRFTPGNQEEFFKAYSDCDKVRRMVRFKSRVNEWGASTGGLGLGAQDDIKRGMVQIHKSGDGAAYLLKALNK